MNLSFAYSCFISKGCFCNPCVDHCTWCMWHSSWVILVCFARFNIKILCKSKGITAWMFLCCKITPSQSKFLHKTPVHAFCFATLFPGGEGGKGEQLTFEHKAVQLWVSVIPPKYSWGAAAPFFWLSVQVHIYNRIICCEGFISFLPLWHSVHSLNWEVLIPQTIPLAFDEDLKSWKDCAKFILLIFHIWRY